MKKCFRYFKRIWQLKECGWCKNIYGGFTQGHCMGCLTKKQIFDMTDEEFEIIK